MASSPAGGVFKTPRAKRVRSPGGGTPVTIPPSPFMKKLGCGTGVNVYLMNRAGPVDASPWAVKKINSRCASKQAAVYQQRLHTEAAVLRRLDHPNIVGFRAFATASDGSECLAMEYGGERSLNDLIEQRREDGLGAFPAASIEKVALHVARGLQYLHTEKQLLHGDMKSCNVVIKGDFDTVKICDVGVSLQLDDNMRVCDPGAYVGTEPWKPLETLEDGGEVTDRADVFAFGLTLWEMMTLAMPHLQALEEEDEEDEGDSEDDSFDEDAYYERLGTRPPLDAEALGPAYRRVVELFYVCTEAEPERRPAAAQIVRALESDAALDAAAAIC